VEVDYSNISQLSVHSLDVKRSKDSESLTGSSLVRNSLAAVMLIDWLVDISSADQQKRISEAIYRLCTAYSWNAMQCSKAGMVTSIACCLQQSASSTLDLPVVGKSRCHVAGCFSVQMI